LFESITQQGGFTMDSERFIHLRDLIGYDNLHISKMFNIDVAEVESYCLGTKLIPDKVAHDLEQFADWSSELSHTAVKRELAKQYLNRPEPEQDPEPA
jgi:hypothetical protein